MEELIHSFISMVAGITICLVYDFYLRGFIKEVKYRLSIIRLVMRLRYPRYQKKPFRKSAKSKKHEN